MTEPGQQPADPAVLWTQARAVVEARVGTSNFSAWIDPLRCTWTAEGLVLEAPDRLTRDRVERHFTGAIAEALGQLGHTGPIRIGLTTPPPTLPIRTAPPTRAHTFDTFVLGQSNAVACTAARDLIAQREPASLFLHGPSGVGKTHLLHAVFHALHAGGVLVACLPAAELVGALVAAYGTDDHEGFWHDLAPVQALLLDDVHSLAGQEEVQEHLMEGLVAWVEGGRLLALTSDRPPADLPRLTVGVRQHFERAVVAGIEPPEPALRLAILERKASALGLVLDRMLATRIALAIGGNVRRLEGALTRLLAHARLQDRPIDEALAERALPELRPQPAAPLTVERIVEATATAFGMPARLLRGRSRRSDLALPRQVAMYLARRLLHEPFAELGAAFARDHSTVVHAWQSVVRRLGADRTLTAVVEQIERRLTGDSR